MAQYRCYISTVGNPDHKQYSPISNPEWIEADTLQDLRAKAQEYQDEWDVIRGVTLLPPQKDLDIPHIMNASLVGKKSTSTTLLTKD